MLSCAITPHTPLGIVGRRARRRCGLGSDAADSAVGVGIRVYLDRRGRADARGVRPHPGRLRLRPRWALQQALHGEEEGTPPIRSRVNFILLGIAKSGPARRKFANQVQLPARVGFVYFLILCWHCYST